MTEYDPTDPFDGSIIRQRRHQLHDPDRGPGRRHRQYLQRHLGQAGAPSITTTDWWDQLAGYAGPVNQLNSPMSFTIEDSNLADFSDAAVFVHPDTNAIDRGLDRRQRRRRHYAHRPDPQQPGRRARLPLHVQRHDLQFRPGRAHQLPDRQRLHRRQRLPGDPPEHHVLQRRLRHPDDRAGRSAGRRTTTPASSCWR